MKTLEQIKNDYAVSKGYLSWKSLLSTLSFDIDFICKHENEVMKIYARECLKLAADNAKADHHLIHIEWEPVVIKGSITNENNIIK